MKKLFSLLIVFMALFTVKVKAATEKINITDVKVLDKSSTITVEDPVLEDNAIKSSIKFNEINDFVIYEVSFENKEAYDYTIDKVFDNNTSSNLSVEYDYSEELLASGTGTLRIKLAYKTKLLNVEKITLDNLSVTMNLTRSDGSKTQVKISNPTTGDNIVKYVFILTISIVGVVLTKKNVKIKNYKVGKLLLILPILILPFAIFAAERFEINIKFSDVEVKGEFEVYDIQVGNSERQITYGQKLGELPADPVKNGYTFDKWIDDDGNTVTEDTVITKPITVSPKFNIVEYTITYNLDEGTATNVIKYTVEDEITLVNPEKSGYTFSGWTGSNGDSLQTSVTIPKGTTGNLTYNANYSANQNTAYTVIHKYQTLNNIYEEETQNLTGATDTYVTPQVIGRTGFNSPTPVEKKIKGDGSTTFEYVYTRINYSVNLDNQYIVSDFETDSYPYGTEITVSAQDREGYNFTGWSNGDENQETTITVTGNITLVPNYEIIKYTVTFDANNGLCGEESRDVNYNTKIGDLPEVTRVGYSFVGWFNGNTEVDENFKPTSNVTLQAHWIKSVDSLSITSLNIELTEGNDETINITNSNEIEETFTYSSNDSTVATVNQNGVVHGVAAGTTTIVITGNTSGQTKEITVTVSSSTPSNPYWTTFNGNYTYFVSLENPHVSSPTGYDFAYEDYQEPSNNNECPSGYAYDEGYDEYVAGCYYVNDYYCDNGDYNFETGMCQYCEIGSYDSGTGKCENVYDWTEYLNDDWTEYLRSDGIKYEVCGVFGSGQASTVCLTGSYYNSNYSSVDGYYSDFEDCNDIDDLITYDGTGSTCLKGYAKAKADEMLSKGASCYFRYDSVECYMPSGDYCAVSSYDGAECGKCKVSNSGYHYCEL